MYKSNTYMPPSATGVPMGANDPQKIRDHHINNLLQKYPTARIIAPDKVDVPVKLNNGQYLNFRVYVTLFVFFDAVLFG